MFMKWFKPKFKEHSATSDPSQGKCEEARKGLHFSEASLNTCLEESINTNALYKNNMDYKPVI